VSLEADSAANVDVDGVELQSMGEGVRSAEEKIILQFLSEARGNRKATAEKLGISAAL